MNNPLTPLFSRIRHKYARFPVSCGIAVAAAGKTVYFSRCVGSAILSAEVGLQDDWEALLSRPHLPDVVTVTRGVAGYHRLLARIKAQLAESAIPLIVADITTLYAALGTDAKHTGEALKKAGFSIKPDPLAYPEAALTALAGYFYLNAEYLLSEERDVLLPLFVEQHPVYSFMRRVPYGEVATFTEAAKEVGLHWNERALMAELAKLPAGAEVPGHRLVNKDGSLSSLFPGGPTMQRERLIWELVPFLDEARVNLEKAKWHRYKYRPLANYLRHIQSDNKFMELKFHEIEKIIAAPLPRAARRLGTWWRDDKPHAYIWQDAGWHASSVNLQQQTVIFARQQEL